MSEDMDQVLTQMREEADRAVQSLYEAVKTLCPGAHYSIQHRDFKPPWCNHCGRNDRGVLLGKAKT